MTLPPEPRVVERIARIVRAANYLADMKAHVEAIVAVLELNGWTPPSEASFKFTRNEHGTVTAVICSCGWVGTGTGGASAFGQAWGAHANETHAPYSPPKGTQ